MTIIITTLFRAFAFLTIALAAFQQGSCSGGKVNLAKNTDSNVISKANSNGADTAKTTNTMKFFVPSYFNSDQYRDDGKGEWNKLIASLNTGDVMIINPSPNGESTVNGVHSVKEIGFVKAVTEATDSKHGIIVFGYVHTLVDAAHNNFHKRPIPDIEADIKTYSDFYGITNIFVDEFDEEHDTHENTLDFYRQLYEYVHPHGMIAINPGAVISEEYVKYADKIVVFEDTYAVYAQKPVDEQTQAYRDYWKWSVLNPDYHAKIIHLVHTAADEGSMKLAIQKAKHINAAYVFVTSNPESTAWDYLPADSYWKAEVAEVRK